jgi:hypothetical protein
MIDCFRPLAPDDGELLRHALDGEDLSPKSKEHIEHCTICQQRLARYTATNRLLLSELYRCECPDVTTLSHYCVGMLSLNNARSVASHLQVCPLCAREVDDTRSELKNFEPFPGALIPPFTSSTPTPKPLATARPDNAGLFPWQSQHTIWSDTCAVYGEGKKFKWPRFYRTDIVNISLHLTRNNTGNILLLGQLSSINASIYIESMLDAQVELYQELNSMLLFSKENDMFFSNNDHPGPLFTTRVDDLGRIAFKAVPSGHYLMIIYLSGAEVVIEGLEIEL